MLQLMRAAKVRRAWERSLLGRCYLAMPRTHMGFGGMRKSELRRVAATLNVRKHGVQTAAELRQACCYFEKLELTGRGKRGSLTR